MKKLALFAILLLSIGASAKAQDTTYDWVSSDGNPEGIDGTITLDFSSSTGGSSSDVVSISITDSAGTFNYVPGDFLTFITASTPFTWNSSQITSMNINAYQGFPLEYDEADLTTGGVEQDGYFFLAGGYEYSDDSGSWDAVSAPDGGSTAILLGMALAGLSHFRHRR